MKLKIYSGTKYLIFLLFLFLCWHQFFYLIDLPGKIDKLLQTDNLVPIGVFLSIVCTLYTGVLKKRFVSRYKEIFNYFFLLIAVIGAEIVFSIIVYSKQSYFTTLKCASVNLIAFASVPVILYLEKGGQVERLLSVMNVISFLWNLLILMQVIYWNANGSYLFDFKTYMTQYFNQGDFGLRISLHIFGNIAILYNLVFLRCTKGARKVWHLINAGLGLYCMIVIQQTRAIILYIFVCIAVWIFLVSKKNWKSLVLQFVALLMILYAVLFTDIVSNFVASFSLQGEKAYSTSARLYAIDYYISCFQRNPIFGNGFADGYIASPYFSVEHGPTGMAYYSDVGLIGILANIGLGAVVVYVIPLIRMFRILYRTHKCMKPELQQFSLLVLIYFAVSSVTYIVVIGRNSLVFAIAIGMFEYADKRHQKKSNDSKSNQIKGRRIKC